MKNEWIKCDDNLPERGLRVIATDGVVVCEAYRRKSDGQWNGWTLLDGEYLNEICAWQPLPEPPQD